MAKFHDLRYGLGTSQADIRKADEIMVKKLKEISKNKADSQVNIQPALRAIQAKIAGEKMGIFKEGQFANFGGIKESDKPRMKAELEKGIQEGFGSKPADLLRERIMEQLKKERRNKKNKQKGSGIVSFLKLTIIPDLVKQVRQITGKRISIKKVQNALKNIKASTPSKMAKQAAKIVLPILLKSVGIGHSGGGDLEKKLEKDILTGLKKYNSGNGLNPPGTGFKFGKFLKGFVDVVKVVAPLVPLLV